MTGSEFKSVYHGTEVGEERVPLRNIRTGDIGFSLGCDPGGGEIIVDLGDGELASWPRSECAEETIN